MPPPVFVDEVERTLSLQVRWALLQESSFVLGAGRGTCTPVVAAAEPLPFALKGAAGRTPWRVARVRALAGAQMAIKVADLGSLAEELEVRCCLSWQQPVGVKAGGTWT